METRRDPNAVIEEILKYVPVNRGNLRHSLLTIQNSTAYLPPEYCYPAWWALVDVLNSELHNPPVHVWEKGIQSIMKRQGGGPVEPKFPHRVDKIEM